MAKNIYYKLKLRLKAIKQTKIYVNTYTSII